MIVSDAAPPMVDALRRVRRCMSRRASPETIYDQRRFTGGLYRTICGGSRGSASLRAPESAHQPWGGSPHRTELCSGRTSSADAALQTAGVAASGQPDRPRAGPCRSKPKAKNPKEVRETESRFLYAPHRGQLPAN